MALAFDHRNSFRTSFMRLTAPPTAEQTARMVAAKRVVVDALLQAVPSVVDAQPTLLIDAEYGGEHVAAARAGGVAIAMPVEVSGQAELRFEDDYQAVIAWHDPDYAKVLVRYNPGGDTAMNARQRDRLHQLAAWLERRRQRLMLELLVPPEDDQLARLGGDRERYDAELRAQLTVRAIDEIGAGGLRPALWKLEGPESAEDARLISEAVRTLDPDAGCLVLGRGADADAVRRWLVTAARTPGFTGFAVGRTVWWEPLRTHLAGGPRDEAVARVRDNYLDLVHAYTGASRHSGEEVG